MPSEMLLPSAPTIRLTYPDVQPCRQVLLLATPPAPSPPLVQIHRCFQEIRNPDRLEFEAERACQAHSSSDQRSLSG